MPHQVFHTSPEERQFKRKYYYASSTEDAGLAHLWHMQRLAAIRLNPSHTIQDAPGVDFHRRKNSTLDYHKQLFRDRHAQQVRHDEARIRTQNAKILKHILLAGNEKARKARHMNLIPTDAQVSRFDNINAQTSRRLYNRRVQQQQISQENQRFLGHLVAVVPNVRTVKQLDKWYTVHKKRVQQLSRFKPAEPFAGARVLEAASSTKMRFRRGGRGGVAGAAPSCLRLSEVASTPPLLRGHPYPPLSVAEAARSAPSALLPALRTTTYGGVPLVPENSFGKVNGAGNGEAATDGHGGASHYTLQRSRAMGRPDWQSISATDIPLLHYAADLQLRRDGGVGASTRARGGAQTSTVTQLQDDTNYLAQGAHTESNVSSHSQSRTSTLPSVRRVAPNEEGGVTQLWRRALQRRDDKADSSRSRSSQRVSPPLRSLTPTPQSRSRAVARSGLKGNGGIDMPRQRPAVGPAAPPGGVLAPFPSVALLSVDYHRD